MLLKAFRIRGYKSFVDSGRCEVQKGVTILAGQNESGKTNILSALCKLNDEKPSFNPDEYCFDSNDSPEITYWFELSAEEIERLQASYPGISFNAQLVIDVLDEEKDVYLSELITSEGEIDETVKDEITSQLLEMMPRFIIYKTLENDIPDSFTAKDVNLLAIKRLGSYLDADFTKIFSTANQQQQRRLTQNLSRNITKDFSQKYRQKDVKLDFSINAGTISIYVHDKKKDSDDDGYPFKLSQRSAGLRWYLNFYIALKGEDLQPGDIVLVDEPGMYLHPKAQQEMRNILNEIGEQNQIVYTTHSPYLIDADNIAQIRLVEKRGIYGENGYNEISEIHSKIHRSNNIDTIKPINDAIGYSLGSELNLRQQKILICEGVSDYYYIKALEIIIGKSFACGITHANGCNNIGRIASLFLGLGVPELFALVDSDKSGIRERKKLIDDGVFESDRFLTTDKDEDVGMAIEDVFNREWFLTEILQYDDTQMQKAEKLLSKEVGKQQGVGKYILAKRLYELAIGNILKPKEVISESGKELVNKLIATIGVIDKNE